MSKRGKTIIAGIVLAALAYAGVGVYTMQEAKDRDAQVNRVSQYR